MRVEISFKNMEASNNLKEFIQEKSLHLKKFFQGKVHLRWIISQERNTHIAHLRAVFLGIDYFAENENDNVLAAIEAVIEKIEHQLLKQKDRMKDHHK